MSNDPSLEITEEAVQAIQAGKFEEAHQHLERVLTLEPENSEALLLQGVVLSKLGRPDEATESFRHSINLDASNPKAFYNFAVHYYSLGNKEQALEMAREAVRLDPSHQAASDLIRRIETETGASHVTGPTLVPPVNAERPATGEAPGNFQAPPVGSYYRGNYYEGPPPHSIKFVEQMGSTWTALGWATVVLCAMRTVLAALTFQVTLEYIQKVMSNPSAPPPRPDLGIYGHPAFGIASLLIVVFMLLWMILDIVDSRGNWLWFVFNCILCCLTLNWMVLLAYMLVGRRRTA